MSASLRAALVVRAADLAISITAPTETSAAPLPSQPTSVAAGVPVSESDVCGLLATHGFAWQDEFLSRETATELLRAAEELHRQGQQISEITDDVMQVRI